MAVMVGGGGGSKNNETKLVPWEGQQPYLTAGYEGAKSALEATPKGPYEGQYFAGPDPLQQQARQMMTASATGGGASQVADQFNKNVQDTMRGDYLDPAKNPWLARTAETINRTGTQNWREQILPTMQSSAIAGGAYGGSRAQIGAQNAGVRQQQGMDDLIAQMYYKNYDTERGRMMNPELAKAGIEAGLAPAMILNEVGGANRADAQMALDEKLKHWQDTIDAPWRGLDRYAGIIGGAISGGGSQPGSSMGTGASVLTGAMGGAATGASIGSVFPGYGTAIGAGAGGILGGLAGLFGRR